MKAVAIACLGNSRLKLIAKQLEKKFEEITIFIPDFSHIEKKYIESKEDGVQYIHMKAYSNNISLRRLNAYLDFSKKVKKKLIEIQPDLIYIIIPPNSLLRTCIKYKRKSPNTKVIADIYDLWPESIPIAINTKKLLGLPFYFWRQCRDRYLMDANRVFVECNYYKYVLKKVLNLSRTKLLYPAMESITNKSKEIDDVEVLNIGYLGSINHITDIDKIVKILYRINKMKPAKVLIVGEGEKRKYFLEQLKNYQIQYKYFGKVFDLEEKQKIFSGCHFGLNFFKETCQIGLSIKAVDYFRLGIPVINSLGADTYEIINKKKCGINIRDIGIDEAVEKIVNLTWEEINQMSRNALNAFEQFFSEEKVLRILSGELALVVSSKL